MAEEPIIRDAIGYSFKGLSRFVIVEDIIKELKLESERYWMRPAIDEDWYSHGDWIILQQEPNPVLINEYELQYDIPYDDSNIETVMFAEFLIDSYIEYIGYLEGCLKQEKEE